MADVTFKQRILNALAGLTGSETLVVAGPIMMSETNGADTATVTIMNRVGANTEGAVYALDAVPSGTNYRMRFTSSSTQINASGNISINTGGSNRMVVSSSMAHTVSGVPFAVNKGSAPVASAALEVVSTGSGFLMPRMTRAQRIAIASPADWLQVIQTNSDSGDVSGMWIYNPLKSGGAGWDRVPFMSEL